MRRISLVSTAILLLLLFSCEIRDTDIFWHLRSGQYIVQMHALPYPDPFSYTSTGASYQGEEITRRFNLTHEWLSQVTMFLVYSAAGFPGLVWARVISLCAFCGITGWIAFRRAQDFYIGLAATLASAGMAFYFAQSRPFLATFVFLALTVAILETRRWVWMLPPIFLVWANCHSGFIIGWMVCAAYGAEALLRYRPRQQPSDAARLWLAPVIAILISGVNSNGFRVFQALSSYRLSGIQTNNLEWQKPIFWTPGVYSFLLFGSLLIMLFAWRRTRPVDWLLYFAFSCISLMAVRNTIFMGLAGPILIAAYLPKWRGIAPVSLVVAAAALLAYDVVPAATAGNTLAFRSADWQFPVGAASFIEAHHITARMFNQYEDGGYLIWRLWPGQRVYIDSRGLSEETFSDYRKVLYDSSGGKAALDLFHKYKIEMLVLQGFDYLSGQVYPVAIDSNWKLVFADSRSVILMRNPPSDIMPLPRTALFDSLAAQCHEHLGHDPLHPRCAFGLSELYAFRGDTGQARHWMSYYIEHRTAPDPAADDILQSLNITALNNQAASLQSKGDLAAAEPLLRQALAIAYRTLGPDHPDTAGAINNLAALLEEKGSYAEAEPLFRGSLEICEKKFGPSDPHTALALDNIAGVLEAKGDPDAEALYRRALSIAERSLGADDPSTRTIRQDLGSFLKARRVHM